MERGEGDAAMNARVRHTMSRQVEQLVRLTGDLLDVSCISLGKIHLKRGVVALGSVLEQAMETCAPSIERAGQHLQLVVSHSPANVHGHSARLVQVFGNLIGNASKYMPEGGRMDVVVRVEGQSTVTSIKDTGIGLAADQLANVFELFTQIDGPMACSKTGLGIGLPLARQLVDLHGGEIEACSEGLGHGSEFVVRLPTCVEAN
jgi:signal transduction histidine kinase